MAGSLEKVLSSPFTSSALNPYPKYTYSHFPPGLTSDPVGRLLKKTALNPAFTLAFLLAARFTKKGSDLSILHETAFKRVKYLFYWGLLRTISGYLDAGALDNWKKDVYNWKTEIVLVTGGAGGIGSHIVKLLAERGIKVVVLDVIPMSFETCKTPYVHRLVRPQLIFCSQKRLLL